MTIAIERMPAERDARAGVAAAAGGCCCCCCCCLHTVGGLIGAATARAPALPSEAAPPTAVVGASTAEPRYSVSKQYWLMLLAVSVFASPLFFFVIEESAAAAETFWFYALLLPALQLAASVVTLVVELVPRAPRPGRRQRLQHLGSITLRTFIGAMIGVVIMLVIGVSL